MDQTKDSHPIPKRMEVVESAEARPKSEMKLVPVEKVNGPKRISLQIKNHGKRDRIIGVEAVEAVEVEAGEVEEAEGVEGVAEEEGETKRTIRDQKIWYLLN